MTVLTLKAAKTYLKLEDADLDDPDLIPAFIASAIASVERIVGALEARTVTERVTGYQSLVLSTLPVLTVTSVTATLDGSAVGLSGHHVDPMSGVVSWATGTPLIGGPYDVVYRAGRAEADPDADENTATVIDADLLLAVKQMLKHLAASYRAGKRRSDTVVRKGQTPTGVDNRPPAMIEMLLAPHRPTGFA